MQLRALPWSSTALAACPVQFSVQVEAAKALNFPRVAGQEEAEQRAREVVRWVHTAGAGQHSSCHASQSTRSWWGGDLWFRAKPDRLAAYSLLCRKRANMLMGGRPKDIKQDTSLPLNAQLLQTTVGVTSEGFQVRAAVFRLQQGCSL